MTGIGLTIFYNPMKRRRNKSKLTSPLPMGKTARISRYGEKSKTICPDQTTGCLRDQGEKLTNGKAASCHIIIYDGDTSLTAFNRCDDGRNESLVAPCIAEKAALQGIGKHLPVDLVRNKAAIKKERTEKSFSFSKTWTPPGPP